ncbi:MAG TPA: glycoside hydrolase family 16 protein [Lacibacter sp.]|nr:glycoside hydrolase family 16 protein [Lacibacter sp.]
MNLKVLLFVLCVLSFSSCYRNSDLPADFTDQNRLINAARPAPPPPPASVEGVCNYGIDETSILAAGWTKVFEDEFTSDLSKWNIWYGGAFNNELQFYQGGNLALANGQLEITARKETVTGPTTPFDAIPKTFYYTSGRIECKSNVSASAATPRVRMMARMKLPAGYGMWPAFWSYGDPWPTQGEIDILEARGQEDFKYQTNYFYGRSAGRNLVKGAEGYINTGTSLQSCYHVYEVIWSQNELKFYFDGVLVKTNSGGYVPNMFGKTERITLNVAVGGLFFSNFNPALIQTGTMYVDWVKVFVAP